MQPSHEIYFTILNTLSAVSRQTPKHAQKMMPRVPGLRRENGVMNATETTSMLIAQTQVKEVSPTLESREPTKNTKANSSEPTVTGSPV